MVLRARAEKLAEFLRRGFGGLDFDFVLEGGWIVVWTCWWRVLSGGRGKGKGGPASGGWPWAAKEEDEEEDWAVGADVVAVDVDVDEAAGGGWRAPWP